MIDATPSARRNDAPLTAPRNYSTDELAALLKVKSQTIRAGLCRDGHYQGLRPVKARNRFLLWPAEQANRLAFGEVAQ